MKQFSADELALLAAIHAAPRDDTPRLVYADWLDEHGEPEYAEFIRRQCRTGAHDQGWTGLEHIWQVNDVPDGCTAYFCLRGLRRCTIDLAGAVFGNPDRIASDRCPLTQWLTEVEKALPSRYDIQLHVQLHPAEDTDEEHSPDGAPWVDPSDLFALALPPRLRRIDLSFPSVRLGRRNARLEDHACRDILNVFSSSPWSNPDRVEGVWVYGSSAVVTYGVRLLGSRFPALREAHKSRRLPRR